MTRPIYDSGPINLTPPRPRAATPSRAPKPAGSVAPPEAREPMPVVVGCPRSGTTLLAVMLDSHPRIAMPPETAFLPELRTLDGKTGDALGRAFVDLVTTDRWGVSNWNDLGLDKAEFRQRLTELSAFSITAGLRVLFGMIAERAGKPLVGEKTPADTNHMPLIASFLPEARFVHIVRDPRDVALSLGRTSVGSSVAQGAQHWVAMVTQARADAGRLRHYHEVRYEDLLAEPERRLRDVCAFLGLEYAPSMLEYRESGRRHIAHLGDRMLPDGSAKVPHALRARLHENLSGPLRTDRAGGWRSTMGADDRATVERIAGALMREFAYAPTVS